MSEKPSAVSVKPVASAANSRIINPEFEEPGESRDKRLSAVSGLEGYGVLDIAGADTGEPEPNDLHNDSSSVIRFYPEWCQCFECLRNKGPYSPDGTFAEHCRGVFLCPPQGPTARIIAFILVFTLGWGFFYLLLEEMNKNYYEHPHKYHERPSPASPQGPIFALGVLEIIGLFSGILMKIFHLPALLGPLIIGIVLRNVHEINLFRLLEGNYDKCILQVTRQNISWNETINSHKCHLSVEEAASDWIKPIREIALTMILTRAGLELSPKQLKKLKGVVPMLAFGPCIVEACACALFTWAAFSSTSASTHPDRMSVVMCFVCGFALAAVSPAVVVPGMLSLKRKNLGTAQGIPTLLIAASSIDDVLAISAYTICLGVALADEKSGILGFIGGPISIIIGIVHGLIVGAFLHFIPSRDTGNKGLMRLVLLLLCNFCAIFGYEEIETLSGAGSLAVLVTSFIASFGWRSQPHWKRPMKKIEKMLAYMWTLCVPLLFGTIGKEIDFKTWEESRIWRVLLVIFASLIVRCITAYFIVWTVKLNCKERLFCAMSWVPKATVQAALAPLVITKVQKLQESPKKTLLQNQAEIVVTTAVLAILITAPLGSCLIAFFGPKLLRKATDPEKETLEDEFPNGDGIDPTEAQFGLEEAQVSKRSQVSYTFRKSVGIDEAAGTSKGDMGGTHLKVTGSDGLLSASGTGVNSMSSGSSVNPR